MKRQFFKKFFLLCAILLQGCELAKYEKAWNHVTEKPYVIRNRLYYPQTNYQYDEQGYASWYGTIFDKEKTAMGVIFHKNNLSAAHRTLPLPSVVIVTNLENGKSLKLVVTDRGPYFMTRSRIIDVSEQAAKLLGFHKKGVTKVRVTCLPEESKKIAKIYKRKPY